MSTICAKQATAMSEYASDRARAKLDDAIDRDGSDALRDACVAGVLEDEVFWHYGELPERMKASFMTALRDGDTTSHNAEVGRIIRAAFDRAVTEALQMRVDRIKAEAMLGEDHD